MRAPVHRAVADGDINLTSMIDVVFLLLVFFVWTSSFDPPERDLPGEISIADESTAASGGEIAPPADSTPPPIDELVIEIGSDPTTWKMGDTSFADLPSLVERLRKIAAIGVQPPVILDVDPAVEMGTAITTLDAARAVGFVAVYFAVENDRK